VDNPSTDPPQDTKMTQSIDDFLDAFLRITCGGASKYQQTHCNKSSYRLTKRECSLFPTLGDMEDVELL
jgi:hypothetical protein